MSIIDQFFHMQRELERLRDPLGLARFRQFTGLPEIVRGPLRTEPEAGPARELPNAFEIARTTSAIPKQLAFASSLSERLARCFPDAASHWTADWHRGICPWLALHDEMRPQDALLLRMIKGPMKLGIASWALEAPRAPAAPAHRAEPAAAAPRIGVAALTEKTPDADATIEVDLEVRCALCRQPIFAASTSNEASWIGPGRLRLKIEVVPICEDCTGRDTEAPGYLQRAMRTLRARRTAAPRPRLEVFDGLATDPTPRGRLQLVPHEADAELA